MCWRGRIWTSRAGWEDRVQLQMGKGHHHHSLGFLLWNAQLGADCGVVLSNREHVSNPLLYASRRVCAGQAREPDPHVFLRPCRLVGLGMLIAWWSIWRPLRAFHPI